MPILMISGSALNGPSAIVSNALEHSAKIDVSMCVDELFTELYESGAQTHCFSSSGSGASTLIPAITSSECDTLVAARDASTHSELACVLTGANQVCGTSTAATCMSLADAHVADGFVGDCIDDLYGLVRARIEQALGIVNASMFGLELKARPVSEGHTPTCSTSIHYTATATYSSEPSDAVLGATHDAFLSDSIFKKVQVTAVGYKGGALPLYAWISIGCGVMFVLAIILFTLTNRKKKSR